MRAAFIVQNDDGTTLIYELIPPIQYSEDFEYHSPLTGLRYAKEPAIYVTIEALRGQGRLYRPGDQVFTETRPIQTPIQSITD